MWIVAPLPCASSMTFCTAASAPGEPSVPTTIASMCGAYVSASRAGGTTASGRARRSAPRSPARRSARPRAPGRPGPSPRRASGSRTSALTRSANAAREALRDRAAPAVPARCSSGTSRPVSPSSTTSTIPPVGARHDGRLARHRLEVDDPERLVDRRAREHASRARQLDHVGLREHLLDPDHAPALGPQPLHAGAHLRARSRACPARPRTGRAAPRGRCPAPPRAGSGTPFWRVMRPTKTTDGAPGSTP